MILYSSTDPSVREDETVADANSYQPFKTVDSVVASRITDELDALGDSDEEGETLFDSGTYSATSDMLTYQPLANWLAH